MLDTRCGLPQNPRITILVKRDGLIKKELLMIKSVVNYFLSLPSSVALALVAARRGRQDFGSDI